MNESLLQVERYLLTENPRIVSADVIDKMVADGLDRRTMVAFVAAHGCGLSPNDSEKTKEFFFNWLLPSFVELDVEQFRNNAYYSSVELPRAKHGGVSVEIATYEAYELFPAGDYWHDDHNRLRAPIGYFTERFDYPSLSQDGREWMAIKPNEVITMQHSIDNARGNVLAFGLGMGYYAYMTLLKPSVNRLTVVDCSPDVIEFFKHKILPQFPRRDCIELVCADAFAYVEQNGFRCSDGAVADTVFTDLWHDAGDGVALYKRMKELESKSSLSNFSYWIEPTLKCYL